MLDSPVLAISDAKRRGRFAATTGQPSLFASSTSGL
jgi:hypothetical protein